jgi:hypothetical protein
VVLEAELLIQWRVLQVVTGTPYLPGLERLSDIFRTAHLDPTGFQIPIPTRTPEEVLGECLAYGIPVAGSRIVYRAPASRRPVALDRVPPAVGPQPCGPTDSAQFRWPPHSAWGRRGLIAE